MDNINDYKDNDISIFSGDELVITKKINPETKEEIFIGGGYTVQSHFLKNNIPIMTTSKTLDKLINHNDDNHDSDDNDDNDDNDIIDSKLQTAGKSSKTYEYLAVPAGIYIINQKIPKYSISENYNKKHNAISDDIYDKLFEYIQYDNKSKRKTRKQRKNSFKKTRKHT